MKSSRSLIAFLTVLMLTVLTTAVSYCQNNILITKDEYPSHLDEYEEKLFEYDSMTSSITVAMPLTYEWVPIGKSSISAPRKLHYAPTIITQHGATVYFNKKTKLPFLWWVYTKNTITNQQSVKMYLPTDNRIWMFGSKEDIDAALQEDYYILNFIDLWEQSK